MFIRKNKTKMKKAYYVLLFIGTIILSLQAYIYITNYNSNLIVRISNCNPNDTLLVNTLIIDDIDSTSFQSQYIGPCFFSMNYNNNLSLGSHSLVLLGDDSFAKPLVEIKFNLFLIRFISIVYQADGTYEYELSYYESSPII
jgi:hypothetical protein